MLIIGIDPGASGGIATLDAAFITPNVVRTFKMPETERDLWLLLDSIKRVDAHAIVERVWSSPQMGVVSAFKFGRNVGVLHMALVAAGIPYDEVTPQKWQTVMGCRSTKRVEFGTKDKNITKRRAQALFPAVKVTHAIADALLLAEFYRRTHNGAQLATRAPEGVTDVEESEGRQGRGQKASEGAEEAAAEDAVRGRQGHRGNRTRGARLR